MKKSVVRLAVIVAVMVAMFCMTTTAFAAGSNPYLPIAGKIVFTPMPIDGVLQCGKLYTIPVSPAIPSLDNVKYDKTLYKVALVNTNTLLIMPIRDGYSTFTIWYGPEDWVLSFCNEGMADMNQTMIDNGVGLTGW